MRAAYHDPEAMSDEAASFYRSILTVLGKRTIIELASRYYDDLRQNG